MSETLRASLQSALTVFAVQPLREASLGFFKTLGYSSQRTVLVPKSSPRAFLDLFAKPSAPGTGAPAPFDQTKALFADWLAADLLFQLTDQELSREAALFPDTTVFASQLRSYIFFAVELKDREYPRGKLAGLARQLNRLFPTPVMVLIKHRDLITLAVINRRPNKLDQSKDVLGRVTLIRDIVPTAPHRGHLDILASLALPALVHPQKKPITDFDTLHAAWEQIFNVELLNERFYRELSNWYFWALPQVEFPADLEPDDEKRRATGLIRLLTRLIFCWFLKEKNLIPEKLFHPADLANILKGFDPESETSSTYYQAILQNLFFATLNQRMGKDGNGKPYRLFATDEGFQKNRATYDVNNLYRYEALFRDDPEAALAHFADIPFLNGGLFECLDRTEDGTDKKRYLDGFSRNAKKRPHVPDRLFFDSGETADLSTAYGDTKRKAEKVTGLITILNRYKFTIVENTPIDQEIALDPELLGKVFENLLASYNEETKTTARKQTGSFYTPRPIVDYMVDESLKAHLERKVAETILSRSSPNESATGLSLLPYNPDAPTEKTRANLPHWTQEGTTYWITFRLADSLPQEKLTAWKNERDAWVKLHPEPRNEAQWKEYDERFGERLEMWLDAGSGECHLRRPELRAVVERCLSHFDGERYDLGPWVIMPNHVHLLLRPREGQKLSKILQGIKGVSAKECNALLGRAGEPFWQEESFDHIVRSQAQFDRFVGYIAENPVKAKLREGESSSDNPVAALTTPGTRLSRLRADLDQLFTYTEEPHRFSEAEVATLIAAIDALKILDPACGSGAFPMGVLHKLVYLLSKLDERNEKWRDIQVSRVQAAIEAAEKIDDATIRDSAIAGLRKQITDIHASFADNELDYGRKLYLIENCLYGVDIQPIAIQITKLRFFISLVCDQKTNRNKKDNHGIRPLPNLETKFVAANTLVGLPGIHPDNELELTSMDIRGIQLRLQNVRHDYFSAQTRQKKISLQQQDKQLRNDLVEAVKASYSANEETARRLASWNPYDPHIAADFFEPLWMFDKSLAHGFDITIGNPPYVRADEQSESNIAQRQTIIASKQYETLWEKWDLYIPFIERSYKLLRPYGISAMIVSDAFCHSKYAQKPQNWFLKNSRILRLDFCGELKIFDAAVHNVITFFQHADGAKWKPERRVHRETFGEVTELPTDEQAKLTNRAFFPQESQHAGFAVPILPLGSICYVSYGLAVTSDDKLHKGEFVTEDVTQNTKDATHPRRFVEGKDLAMWLPVNNRWLEWGTKRAPSQFRRITFPQLHTVEKILAQRSPGPDPKCCYDDLETHFNDSSVGFVSWHALHGVRNNSLKKAARYRGENPPRPDLPRREELEATSSRFAVKYLLGVVNSGSAREFLRANRRSNIHLYPDDWKKLPIPDVSAAQQKPIIALVDQILTLKRANPAADINALETQLDDAVAKLYGLTPEEIATVEGTAP